MRHFRTDRPDTNPRLKVDARQPRRDHRALRADNADPIRDAQDVTSARRDAAISAVRSQHKTARRGYTRDDTGEGPAKPQAKPSMTAADAAEAIRNAHRRK